MSNKKLSVGKNFFRGIGDNFYEDERYYKLTKEGTYKLKSMTKLLKEQYPEKYEALLKKERERAKENYKRMHKKVKCECGCYVISKGFEKHKQTNKHNRLMKLND